MKRNLIVLCGAVIVIVSALFVPVITFTQRLGSSYDVDQISQKEVSGVLIGIVLLLVMLLKWRWRGTIWIVLSIAGAIYSPVHALSWYAVGKNFIEVVEPVAGAFRGPPSFTIGLFLIIAGYLIVIVGGIWDIVQKRKQQEDTPPTT